MSKSMTSTKPYIVRAFYDWISDNQLTPYIAVDVNVHGVMVPMSFVNDGQIILNISAAAVGGISMVDEQIEFCARFAGKLEHIVVPFGAVSAIYAKENGAGTTLAIEHPELPEVDETPAATLSSVSTTHENKEAPADKEKSKGRASLKIVK